MSRYLMAISIGPVQGFIGAARRTRDFWMGSAILSECAKAIARCIAEPTASDSDPQQRLKRLIFPAPTKPEDLQPWDFDQSGNAPLYEFNATNVVLCQVDASDPASFASRAKDALIERWKEFVTRTVNLQIPDGSGRTVELDLDQHTWPIQRDRPDDIFDFFAAWVPFDGDYSQARHDVMRLLNGRKALRDFAAWIGIASKPKSSLDGARESILKPPEDRLLPLRIKENEQLDIVGLVKRLEFGNDSIRFPSVSRFAADPWIRGALQRGDRNNLQRIHAQCEELVNLGTLTRRQVHPNQRIEDDPWKFSWWDDFPYEGTPLFVNRHSELLREDPQYCTDPKQPRRFARWQNQEPRVRKSLGAIGEQMKTLSKSHGAPSPYFAVLAADGDHMGEALSWLAQSNDPQVHRAFSSAQTRFADLVRRHVNSPAKGAESIPDTDKFHGAVVYAGADDVLAFLPLDQCVRCARVLHDLFNDTLRSELLRTDQGKAALTQLDGAGRFPTLSVGIAIGHFLEPLEDLLHWAREAEQRAKNPSEEEKSREQRSRDGLGIAFHTRGGAPIMIRDNWKPKNDDHSLDNRLTRWAALHQAKLLPTKAAYDLRQLGRQYDGTWQDTHAQSVALQRDALRVLGRKRALSDDTAPPEHPQLDAKAAVKGLISSPNVKTSKDLVALANEMIIGQRLGDAMLQAEGRRASSKETRAVVSEGSPT